MRPYALRNSFGLLPSFCTPIESIRPVCVFLSQTIFHFSVLLTQTDKATGPQPRRARALSLPVLSVDSSDFLDSRAQLQLEPRGATVWSGVPLLTSGAPGLHTLRWIHMVLPFLAHRLCLLRAPCTSMHTATSIFADCYHHIIMLLRSIPDYRGARCNECRRFCQ